MIRVLDSFVADKIAAGEVIERPLSIVKELLENSIDAGATNIIAEIRHGGKSYIRITDNGSGIPEDEVELAFERHATGKIHSLEDLEHLSTLGFRGEALASITAVSRLTIFTKTEDERTGIRMEMHGGRVVSKEKVGVNTGTTMVVEDVFYNTPARRKFMRSDAAEASAVIDLVQKMAVYYSGVAFKMINNGQTVLTTSGDGNPMHAAARIYPTRDFRNLMEIRGEFVHGYISGPGVTRNNRSGQIFFVNGRYIKSAVLEKGLSDGYGSRVFSGYPIAILFVQVPPETIDVNIHPNKKEIKFLEAAEVERDLANAVRSVIQSENAVPDADTGKRPEPDSEPEKKKEESAEQVGIREFLANQERPEKGTPTHTFDTEMLYDKQYQKEHSGAVRSDRSTSNETVLREDSGKYHSDGKPEEERSFGSALSAAAGIHPHERRTEHPNAADADIFIQPPKIREFRFDELIIRGYVFNTYIITESGENIYILDQHAAHERILYERLISQYNSDQHSPQQILTPIIMNTSSDVYCGERGWMDMMRKLGFEIEDFGTNTFIIKGIPAFMTLDEAERFAKDVLDAPERTSLRNTTVVNKLIMRSCKSAVKASDALSDAEISDLLKQLSKCVNPFSCPHGRPTFVRVTKYEMERAFKRK